MTTPPHAEPLSLGHLLAGYGIDSADVLVIRHTYTPGGIRDSADLADADGLRNYTSRQSLSHRTFPKDPPRLWVTLIADGGSRCRLLKVYENRGELLDRRTDDGRVFDLVESDALAPLLDRLVIDWGGGAIRWWNYGPTAGKCSVVEIADREGVPFPGFDWVCIDHSTLRAVIAEDRYREWRAALSSVHGIYLIADKGRGRSRLYVGKADGDRGILGRWEQYARDGHGGNAGLREVLGLDPDHVRNFQYSILRVFGPSTPQKVINDAEVFYMQVLLSRGEVGLNQNGPISRANN